MVLMNEKIKIMDFDSIKVGDSREFTHQLTQEDVQRFAALTGDTNPLHLDEAFAKKTDFRKPVVHGMLSASYISTMIGMFLPGPGSLWLSQTLKFLHQAYVGDELRIFAKVKQRSPATRILILETIIYNQKDEELIKGEAQVRLLELGGGNDNMEKKTKVVLVTGASRGIGAAVAKKLAHDGHAVVINYVQSKNDALGLADAITLEGGKAIAIQANIADKNDVQRMCDEITAQFGPIDALVQNASGAINMKPFDEVSWEDIQSHLDIQVKGAFNCMQAILPGMIEQGGGSVVTVGSIAADSVPPAQQTAYVLSKAALSAFAKSLAVEYGPKNIRVNIVSPGMTETDLTTEISQKAKELTRMTTSLRRLAQPEDVANTVAFLISSDARHISGETVRVCGGAVMI